MPSPVLPDEFKAIIPAANSSLCRKLVLSLIKFPQLFYKWFSWAYNADGTTSDNFKTSVGAVPLDPDGLPVGQIAVPSGVDATDGSFNDKVQVSWSAVKGAASYEVWRSLTADITQGELLSNPTASPYNDVSAEVGTTYHYWVKAKTAAGLVSGASFPDTGYSAATGTGGGGTKLLQAFPVSGTWPVPEGVTAIWVKLWGGGGGGGAGKGPYSTAPRTGLVNYGGSGGGGGELIVVGAITVAPGDILSFTIGNGGDGAGTKDNKQAIRGNAGGTTILRRGPDQTSPLIADAFGGEGGSFGQDNPSTEVAGGTGGQAYDGTLLTGDGGSLGGTVGLAGGSATTPNSGAGGIGGAASPGATNKGGNGGPGYGNGSTNGGPGKIAFYK